ncbi:MAG: division/cell wall cluster transcriptional repressor MraZ, partial [Saprospiraceae bacterium]|nr:division/cell wall cluster transcriptional repressor MraZ [Saprospiraceae bacterium]
MIYPEKVWENTLERINELNVYRTEDRNFIRYFFRGVSDVTTDATDRILVNKGLLDYAGIRKDVILFAYLDRIEMWDKKTYDEWLNREPEDFANLAERVLGKAQTDQL